MKRFIYKTILFLLPIIIPIAAIELSLRAIPNDYSYKAQWLENNSSSIRIWCFGSSHVFFGINPIHFEKTAFNSAHVSQGIEFDHFIFKKYVSEADSLETVIIPISYFTLWSNLEKGPEKWRIPNYHIYYGCNDMPFNLRFKFNNESKPFNRAVKSFLKRQNDIGCSELGWGTYSFGSKSSDWKETGLSACKRHTIKNKDAIIYEHNINYSSFASSQFVLKMSKISKKMWHSYCIIN